ncbi:MAG TPA: citrate (Si)-synthase, partial [Acetobacteraceae bacterium]|nr:citrate (Si)-synthase [Acetobacteraceae bacterium]
MTNTAKGSVTVTLDGSNRSVSLPLHAGTLGPAVVDIRKLYGELGIFTFDPGYGATASCDSA